LHCDVVVIIDPVLIGPFDLVMHHEVAEVQALLLGHHLLLYLTNALHDELRVKPEVEGYLVRHIEFHIGNLHLDVVCDGQFFSENDYYVVLFQ